MIDFLATPFGRVTVGTCVQYQTFMGGVRTVEVVRIDDNFGRPVFDGTDASGNEVWGYAEQVCKIY